MPISSNSLAASEYAGSSPAFERTYFRRSIAMSRRAKFRFASPANKYGVNQSGVDTIYFSHNSSKFCQLCSLYRLIISENIVVSAPIVALIFPPCLDRTTPLKSYDLPIFLLELALVRSNSCSSRLASAFRVAASAESDETRADCASSVADCLAISAFCAEDDASFSTVIRRFSTYTEIGVMTAKPDNTLNRIVNLVGEFQKS